MPLLAKCRECGSTETQIRCIHVAPLRPRPGAGPVVAIDYFCVACQRTHRDVVKGDYSVNIGFDQ